MNEVSNALEMIKQKVREDEDVLALLSFGSYARGEKYSDIDLCIVLNPGSYDELYLSKKKLEYLTLLGPAFDVQIFQQLPIYIKIRVLGDGKVAFCRDEPSLYDLAFQTIRDFESFDAVYHSYLGAVASG